jgi:hypothetical protein
MTTLTLPELETIARYHKQEVKHHRVQLRLTMARISEIKARLESVGIQNGVATEERHGPEQSSAS